MATRFYLPASGAAAVLPAFAAWLQTTGASQLKCVTTKINTALVSRVIVENAATGNLCGHMWVSDPIPAQTITGTVKGILRCLEPVALQDARAQMVARVVSNNGTTYRSPNLVSFDDSAVTNEWQLTSPLTNRKFPKGWTGSGLTVGTVVASANDRIVIELGGRVVGGEGTVTIEVGDPTGSDCAENETGTSAFAPWIEFSQDLFGPAVSRGIYFSPGFPRNRTVARPIL